MNQDQTAQYYLQYYISIVYKQMTVLNKECCLCSRYRYIRHFYCLAVEAGFYSDVVECLPLDPAAQVRFPPRAVGIFFFDLITSAAYFHFYPKQILLCKITL